MCGIAGFTRAVLESCDAPRVLERMGASIRHRGPDAGDQYLDEHVGLRHQRLSIIDTSELGAQPMRSASGRFVIVYNGEVYNFPELRRELEAEGVRFRGHSDTEVILALYEKTGSDCLSRLNGMFAIAVWDRELKSLFLARDRLGKKPLYVWRSGQRLAFASEIKALLEVPGVERRLRPDAVKDFFAYQYVPDPKSIFENIEKLAPGHCMHVEASGVRTERWWDVSFATPRHGDENDFAEELLALLDDSVRRRMLSDVPLGAFLSGGVDSSAVVGLMSANSETPVTTCAIGFESEAHDETVHAAAVARLFKTDHHEFTVGGDVEASLIEVAAFFDEPFADPSFLPTYFVSRMARRAVTVALAGDGGDESFAGYGKYLVEERERRWRGRLPASLRHDVLGPLGERLSGSARPSLQRGANLLRSLGASSADGFFICNSFFREDLWRRLATGPLARSARDHDPAENTRRHYAAADTDDPLGRALYTDLKTYLPGDILVKVDRMSMANSLECRAPFLDYRIVEFAASLPSEMKLRDGTSKYLLKRTLSRLLPDEILQRRKMGFVSPVADWLRHGLRQPFERHVFAREAASAELFDARLLGELWRRHLGGDDTCVSELWSIFMFELWWRRFLLA